MNHPSRSIAAHTRVALLGLAAAFGLAGCADVAATLLPTPRPVIVVLSPTPDASLPAGGAAATTMPTPDATTMPTPDATTMPTPDGATAATPAPERILERVRARGRLICGTNAELPGFGLYDPVRDNWTGFDVDFCRAVAAAIFGDATRVDFVALTTSGANERFEAIRSGRVDVLFRNTTWTLGRNVSGLAFGPTTFHDGQTFMVRRDSGINSIDDLAGKTVCVAEGTTSQQNLSDDFAARGIDVTVRLGTDEASLYPAYDAGECDAVTSDSSQLAGKRLQLDEPQQHVILGDRISREPLGPVLPRDDNQWLDVISWTVFATIYAEELRVDQATVAEQAQTATDPRIRRLLGIEGAFGSELGLTNDFALQIIRQVGNYGDIYLRNLGPETPLDLDRGPNKAWNLGGGGVLASPPFR
jgi:general L-amino acid transport system substrate-binding protein